MRKDTRREKRTRDVEGLKCDAKIPNKWMPGISVKSLGLLLLYNDRPFSSPSPFVRLLHRQPPSEL